MTGKLAPELQRKKQLYKLIIAQSDIAAAALTCQLLLDKVKNITDPLYYPLLCAIVTCYARPFIANTPLGSLPKRWQEFTRTSLQQTHSELIETYIKLIKHSDHDDRVVTIIPSRAKEHGSDKRSDPISFDVKTYYFPLDKIKVIKTLCDILSSSWMDEIENEVKDIYSGILPQRRFILDLKDILTNCKT